jgi:hypothetical protein
MLHEGMLHGPAHRRYCGILAGFHGQGPNIIMAAQELACICAVLAFREGRINGALLGRVFERYGKSGHQWYMLKGDRRKWKSNVRCARPR